MRPLLPVCCAALICLGRAPAQAPRLNKALIDKQVTIRRVVLLPAHVAFSRIGTRGSEGGILEGDQIAESFYHATAHELSSRGVEVLPNPEDQDHDNYPKYGVADIQARYDNIAIQLRRKPRRVEQGAFTLGDRVAAFEPAAAADAIVVLRGFGRIYTPGRKALALLTQNWFGIAGRFDGEVAFISSRTGKVLVFVRFQKQRDMTEKADEQLAGILRRLLRNVPLPMPPAK